MQPTHQLLNIPSLEGIINKNPLTVTPETSIIDAIALLNKFQGCYCHLPYLSPQTESDSIHHPTDCVVVVDSGQILSIFTQKDVVQLTASGIDLSQIKISQVMVQPVVTLKQSPEENAFTALLLMRQHQVNHLPIVDDEEHLLGIVTYAALLQVFDPVVMLSVIQTLAQQLQVGEIIAVEHTQEAVIQAKAELSRKIEQLSQKPGILVNNQAQGEIKFAAEILSQMSDAVLIQDSQYRITYCNQGSERLYGIKAKDFIGRPQSEAYEYRWLKPEDEQAANNALTNCGFWRGENIVIKQDGAEIYVESSVSLLKDERGDTIGYLSIVRDISDRKRLELALQASQTKLNDILTSAIASILCFRVFPNRDWEYEYQSPGCAAVFGYTAKEILTNKTLWMSQVFPEDREHVIMPLFADIFAERTVTVEYRFYHKDGELRWISATYTSRRDEAANCWVVTGVSTDVTQQKQTESALREEESRLRAIGNNLPNGAIYQVTRELNESIKFHYISAGIEGISGHKPEEIVQDADLICNQFPEPDRLRLVEAKENSIRNLSILDIQLQKCNINGELRWVHLRAAPRYLADGRIIWDGVMIDITDLKQAESALVASQERYRSLAQKLHLITTTAPAYIFEVDCHGRILFTNRTYEGITQEQVIGTLLTDWFPEAQRSEIALLLDRVFR
ncbi:MAG: PAS domain S-box protein, partial [Nostocaceae cyanobacterium]|nr:PAS domain S-box protein [Nostocaceae cyanobacterium]